MKQTEILTRVTHVNGREPAVYMSYTSQNFRLFHVSNLSVRNFRIFLLMYPGSMSAAHHLMPTPAGDSEPLPFPHRPPRRQRHINARHGGRPTGERCKSPRGRRAAKRAQAARRVAWTIASLGASAGRRAAAACVS